MEEEEGNSDANKSSDDWGDHWPDGYIFPNVNYDRISKKFVADFGHKGNPDMERRIFVRGVKETTYRPATKLDHTQTQEGLVVDCSAPYASFLENELSDDGTGLGWVSSVRFDIQQERIVDRLKSDDITVPEEYERLVDISDNLRMCRNGMSTVCIVTFEPGNNADNAYDFWVCELEWDSGDLELIAPLKGPFC